MTRTNPRTGRECLLPDGSEIATMRAKPKHERPTFQDIADRYGVSRQAVYKALASHNARLTEQSVNGGVR